MDYSSDELYNPSIGIVTITCETLGQYRYLLITQCIQYFGTCRVLCVLD